MQKTQGLLLKAIPHLGKGQILKVFTPTAGLLTLITKKGTPSPFCIAEWIYKEGKTEMGCLHEVSLTDPLLSLRETYSALKAAGQIARALLFTQLPAKQAPTLYELSCRTLQKLASFKHPDRLSTSFLLKLLVWEGLLDPEPLPSFSKEQQQLIEVLAHSKKYSEIGEVPLDEELKKKIVLLFEESTQ